MLSTEPLLIENITTMQEILGATMPEGDGVLAYIEVEGKEATTKFAAIND